jgi:hypothetical protein
MLFKNFENDIQVPGKNSILSLIVSGLVFVGSGQQKVTMSSHGIAERGENYRDE